MNEEVVEVMYKIMKSLDRIADSLEEKKANCAGCGEPYAGSGLCPECRCSDTCGCTNEERGQ